MLSFVYMQFTENVEKIVHFALVLEKFPQKDIADEFHIAKSYVSKIINKLCGMNLIERKAKNSFFVSDKTRLLLLWAVHRKPRKAYAKIHLPLKSSEIIEFLERKKIDYSLCMISAFSKINKSKTDKVSVYLKKQDIKKLKDEFPPDKHGNLIIFEGKDNEFFGSKDKVLDIYLTFADLYSRGFLDCFSLLKYVSTHI